MINVYLIAVFFVTLLYNFVPGYFLIKQRKQNIISLILLSVLLSIAINNLFVQIFSRFLNIEITKTLSLIYLLLLIVLSSFVGPKKPNIKPFTKYDKYFLLTTFLFLGTLFANISFDYVGFEYDDMPRHTAILKESIEEGGFIKYQPHFFVKAENHYTMAMYSPLILSLILLGINDALLIANALNTFYYFIAAFAGFIVFLIAELLTKDKKIAFYSGFLCLFIGFINISPIFWGGYQVTLIKIISFSIFIYLWKAIINEDINLLLLTSILGVTAVVLRPSVIIHFPIILICLFLTGKKDRKTILKYIISFLTLVALFSIVFYLDVLLIYFKVLFNIEEFGSLTRSLGGDWINFKKFSYWFSFILPLFILSIPSFKDKRVKPLTFVVLVYFFILPLIQFSRIFDVPFNDFFAFFIPLSVLAGTTWVKYVSQKKILNYLGLFLCTLFFLTYIFYMAHGKPENLDEKELSVLYWMNDNLHEDAVIFYINQEKFYDWIVPVTERTAMWGTSPYSPQIVAVENEFRAIAKKVYANKIDKGELEMFFNEYRVTHIILSEDELNKTGKYFEDYDTIYNDRNQVILSR